MLIFKSIVYLFVLFMTSACSARSSFTLPLGGMQVVKNMRDDIRASQSVSAEHCVSRRTFPFFWQVNMDHAVEKTLEKAPGAIALSSMRVTHKVNFYLVYSSVCVEVTGFPVYLDR